MSELKEFLTQDGTISLRNLLFEENFHSLEGALKETETKFTTPSDLKRFKDKSISVLDICFGLGYNSASLFDNLIKQNSYLSWYALEIDKKPLEYSLKNKSFHKLWNPKVLKIFKSIHQNYFYKDRFFDCNIFWGEAREKIDLIPSKIKFDLIYLDGFSPQKCPQLWTVEFLSKVIQKLNPEGYLITYSSSAAVRNTLRNLNLNILNIIPSLPSRRKWSAGTIAIKQINEKQLKNSLHFKKLTHMEEEHLLTKASIPYRDPNLNSTAIEIFKKREREQLLSNLKSSKEWRNKWGMTKSTFNR